MKCVFLTNRELSLIHSLHQLHLIRQFICILDVTLDRLLEDVRISFCPRQGNIYFAYNRLRYHEGQDDSDNTGCFRTHANSGASASLREMRSAKTTDQRQLGVVEGSIGGAHRVVVQTDLFKRR